MNPLSKARRPALRTAAAAAAWMAVGAIAMRAIQVGRGRAHLRRAREVLIESGAPPAPPWP